MKFVIEMEPEGNNQEEQGKEVHGEEAISNEEPIQFTIEEFTEDYTQPASFTIELDESADVPNETLYEQQNKLSDEQQTGQELVIELHDEQEDHSALSIDVMPEDEHSPIQYTAEDEEAYAEEHGYGSQNASELSAKELKVRLDKWLWAARFYKTRPLARAAVEKGFVFYNGMPTTPNREVQEGATLKIRQGRIDKMIKVKKLSTRRRSAQEASELYEETFQEATGRDRNYMRATSPYRRQEFRQQQPRSVRYLRRSYHKKGGSFAQNGHPVQRFEGEYEY